MKLLQMNEAEAVLRESTRTAPPGDMHFHPVKSYRYPTLGRFPFSLVTKFVMFPQNNEGEIAVILPTPLPSKLFFFSFFDHMV